MKNGTNDGDLCKTEYTVCGKNKDDVALIIHRLVLSSPKNEYFKLFAYPLKTYKNKTLWQQQFAIRLNTLKDVVDWLNTLDLENEFK